ncbi:virulence factor [Enterococcus sp. PF1-24]|uniref:Gfo/Idh/MocA family protein n=1 Tax=unclassified Enterococcus TaxID=2608891 RepID=UPI0024772116|nr:MULTISPECIES: Gfo/Idh/MocA family oxidoreductase [unclassified Enterococcus]MDH6365416.1 virulence factor [Enterococcus sp. PFB1-1]MDH6402512.1 virulence factor [Enterococcus sp. PF1-24]
MKIGVIGLGDIAKKAYMATYSQHREQAQFLFSSRSNQKQLRQWLKDSYNFDEFYPSLTELIAAGIEACFIHAGTSSHYELAKQCLTNGIHVYLDKPISQNLAEVQELTQLAEAKNCIFMVGFNRRFAPLVEKLKEIPEKRIIKLQKNVSGLNQDTEFAIYDVFSHLVDTLVYLLDEPIQAIHPRVVEEDGSFSFAVVSFETTHSSGVLTMDYHSGSSSEVYEITSPTGTHRLTELVEYEWLTDQGNLTKKYGSWESTLYKRGFEQMLLEFIAAVKNQSQEHLKQEKILLTHQLCDEIIKNTIKKS